MAVGADLVEIRRIAALVERYGERFIGRVFTPGELADCGGRAESLAARWAAKEAVAKALGVGIGEVAWQRSRSCGARLGTPGLGCTACRLGLAAERGLAQWALSLAHDGGLALAFVVAV